MSSSVKKGSCLVARAVPCPIADSTDEMVARLEQLTVEEFPQQKSTEIETHSISPSDFVSLQSIRSSALARKTNTTLKFSKCGPGIFNDLLNKEEKNKKAVEKDVKKREKEDCKEGVKNEENVEKAERKEAEEEEGSDDDKLEGELLSRGPERNVRSYGQYHPYQQVPGIQYGAAALSTVHDYTAFSNYGGGYECGTSWGDSPDNMGYISQSSTPDTMLSDQGYISSSPAITSPQQPEPFTEQYISNQELGRLLDSTELPEQLADFILKFSRQYTSCTDKSSSAKGARPCSADSGVESPMSARSAPNASPEVPQGGHSGPTTPSFNQTRLSPRKSNERTAKMQLRKAIPEGQLDDAWAWALKSYQFAPQALTHQDNDRDTLLHIVTAHRDLGKIYSLVEHHLKMDNLSEQKPFDLCNKHNETPLFLAVMNRLPEVVAYLLEIGADPNNQTLRGDRDSALHYAAARGMHEITEMLCIERGVHLNKLNARGQTPLHVAVRNQGAIEEATQIVIDNKKCIVALLKAGADPLCVDATNGKTIVHFAIERMDADLIDVLRRHIDDDVMTDLVNRGDFNGDKPMKQLQQAGYSDAAKMGMILPLLTCGAEMK